MHTISGKNEVAMNHFVTLGFVVLLVTLVVALPALQVIDLRPIMRGWIAWTPYDF